MFDDFKELLSVFNAHSVKYLIVGGYAVSFHAQPRATKDLDLFIQAEPSDLKDGLMAFFISKSDLIASKLAAGRLRDLADIEEIRDAEAST